MESSLQKVIINRNGERFGPYTLDEARAYLAEGRILHSDTATVEGTEKWLSVATILGIAAPAPPLPAAAPPPLPGLTKKNSATRVLLVVGAFVFIIILFAIIGKVRSNSPEGTVRSFLDAAIAHRDGSAFLADGVNESKNPITSHEVTSYELNNTADDVVSATVHFKGTRTQGRPTYDGMGHNTGRIITGSEEIDMPEQIRFRVKNGRITEVF
jgi:hypothetical protein